MVTGLIVLTHAHCIKSIFLARDHSINLNIIDVREREKMSVPKKLRVLKVHPLEICIGLGSKLTRNSLKTYSEKYITQKIVRPELKQALGEKEVKVSCWAKWNKEKKRLEGKLTHKGNCYQWIIKKVPVR